MAGRTIIKNTIAIVIANLIGRALSFFLIIAIAMHLGDVGMGIYSFAFAFIGIIGLANDFGLTQLMIRDIAKNKQETKKYFFNFITLKLALGLITTVVAILLSIFVAKTPESMAAIWVVTIATFFLEFAGAFSVLFSAYELMEYNSMITIIERLLSVSIGLAVLFLGGNVTELMAAFLVSYLCTFLFAYWITLKKFFKPKLSIDIKLWRHLIKEAMPFWLTGVFNTIYFRIDTVMLALMTGYAVTGWYSAAHSLLDAVYFIPGSIIAAVFPSMSRLSSENRQSLEQLYKKTFYYLFLLGLPIGIATTILADKVILFIYPGDDFLNSINALKILIWAEVIIFVSYLNGYLLNSINKQRLFTYATAFGAVANVLLNFILIQKYSYIGASIAIVISELIVFLLLIYFVSRNGFRPNLIEISLKPIIAGSLMAIILLYSRNIIPTIMLTNKDFSLFLIAAAGGFAYLLTLVLLRGIGEEELNMIKSLLPKKERPA